MSNRKLMITKKIIVFSIILLSSMLLVFSGETKSQSPKTKPHRIYRISIKPLPLTEDQKISNFKFKIHFACVVTCQKMPWGWTLDISNESNPSSIVEGSLVEGKFAVPPEYFRDFQLIVEKWDYAGKDVEVIADGEVTVFKDVKDIEEGKQIKLDKKYFIIKEDNDYSGPYI